MPLFALCLKTRSYSWTSTKALRKQARENIENSSASISDEEVNVVNAMKTTIRDRILVTK
jgi:hypothetical protein